MTEPAPDLRGRVHVVVATRDRRESLLRTLEKLTELPSRPGIVVADNASTDGTAQAVAARFPGVAVLRLPVNLGATARTVAAANVAADIVAFSDDDSWWAPGSLERAVALFDEHPSLGLIAGRILVGEGRRVDPVSATMASSPIPGDDGLPGRPVLGFVCCGAIVRRRAFLAAGGFHPRFGIGAEEGLLAVDLASRGWALRYVDDVVAHHHPSASGDREGRRRTVIRNDLWAAWLRRPAGRAVRRTAGVLRQAGSDPASRRAVAEAARGWRWVLDQRRVVPPDVEARLRLLESG